MTSAPGIDPAMRRIPAWPVISTFVIVILAFLASITVSQVSASRIHDMSQMIARNAAPSIEYLATTRTDIFELRFRLEECVRALEQHQPPPIAEGLHAEADIAQSVREYRQLPEFPGEHEVWNKAQHELDTVQQIFEHGLAAVQAGDLTAAKAIADRELPPAVERASLALYEDIHFNADHIQANAEQIENLRQYSKRLAYSLGILAALFTIGLGIMMSRALRRYAQLQSEYARLIEERVQELDLFAARVAHDVMNPLTAVNTTFQMAPKMLEDPERLLKALDRGASSTRRAVQIVEGLYSFARAGARPESDVSADVGTVLHDLVKDVGPVADRAHIDLTLESFEPCAVACAPGVLHSLAANLVSNAIKYSAPDPESFANGESNRGQVTVRVVSGPRVRIEVQDTGPGLPPGLEQTVFEPYVRAKGVRQPGLGLGLATVKRLSEAHGGACGVRSVPGQGATFWFELPGVPLPASHEHVESHAEAAPPH